MEIMLFLLLVVGLVGVGLLLRVERRLDHISDSVERNALKIDNLLPGRTVPSAAQGKAEEKAQAVVSPAQAAARESAARPPPLPVTPRQPEPASGQAEVRPIIPVRPPVRETSPSASGTAAPEEREPGVMQKMWNWLLVGEEHRRKGVSVEQAVASTWMLRVSIIAIVAGIAYFIKWSLDQDLLTPAARIAVGILAGTVMLIGGLRLIGKRYHLIGQGLLGGGLLTMYVNIYAANQWYGLLAPTGASALMICVVVAAGLLAVRSDSLLIAILGLAGGYLTPLLMRTAEPRLLELYIYLLLLSVGILAVSNYKHWHLLNLLGFVGTYSMFGLSLRVYQDPHFAMAISFLSAMFAVHSSLVYLYNIRRGIASSVLEVVQLVANATLFAGLAYHLISTTCGRPYPALLALGLAGYYIAHVLLFLRRGLNDRKLLTALIALAAAALAWALPLMMEKESLTIAFALLAITFLWLGQRLDSNFLTQLAYAVYGFLFMRLMVMDLPRDYGTGSGTLAPLREYWPEMLRRLWTFGFALASIAGGYVLQRKPLKTDGKPAIGAANDTAALLPRTIAGTVLYWLAVIVCFLCVHLEVNRFFLYYDVMRLPVLTMWWSAMALYFLMQFHASRGANGVALVAMTVMVLAVMLKLFSLDLASWDLSEELIYGSAYRPMIVFARGTDFLAAFGLCLAAWGLLGRHASQRALRAAFGYGALLVLFVFASLELRACLHWTAPAFTRGGLSVLWAVFAVSFIAGGLWRRVRPIRYAGLILFVIVVIKVVLFDLGEMAVIVKVMAFVAVGILMLLGSAVYIHTGQRIGEGKKTE